MPELYQGRERAASYLGITTADFTAAVKEGEIKSVDGPGVGALYRRVDLDAWLAARTRKGADQTR